MCTNQARLKHRVARVSMPAITGRDPVRTGLLLEKAGVSETVLFPSEGLSVGFFQQADYAVRVCRAFNDYVAERYRKVDKRLYPMGLIAMQDVKEAVKELRRLVLELKLPGAMLPSRGLPLHLGHDY